MGSFNVQHSTRIAAINPISFVAPVLQPARRADSKVGVTAARFAEMAGMKASIFARHSNTVSKQFPLLPQMVS